VTANELKRKLSALGCKFEEGRKHTVIIYNREGRHDASASG